MDINHIRHQLLTLLLKNIMSQYLSIIHSTFYSELATILIFLDILWK